MSATRAFSPALAILCLGTTLAADAPPATPAAVDSQVRSIQVSPSGNVLLARFKSNVASVKAGASYSINGGAPIVLADPMWDSGNPPNSDWVWWPLGPKRHVEVLDDSTDATLKGGWTNKDPGNTAFNPGYYQFQHSQFSQAAGVADTATYHKTLPAPGRYRLSAGIVWLFGPDRTAAQTYTVSDGRGVVGTFTVDMTKPPSWDRVDNLIRLHDLGQVTLRDTGLTVVVSNGTTRGNLVTDALVLELDPPPAVSPGDVVTFSAPAGTVTTTAGPVGDTAAAPVTYATDADWFPFDPARKPTMAVGYNKTFDVYDYGSRTYADRFRSSTGWLPVSGTFRVDENGHLTAISGRVKSVIWDAIGAGDDGANWPNVPLSGTAVFRFRYAKDADPGCTLANDSGAIYTFGARKWDPTPGPDGKKTLRIPYARPRFVPLGQATTPYATVYTFTASFQTTVVVTDVEFTLEGETPDGYPLLTNPIAIDRYRGRNFGALRFLDSMNGNGPNTTEYADWPTHAAVSGRWWGNPDERPTGKPPAVSVGLATIAPIDADDIARYCRKMNFAGWVKARTSAPHGLVTGQRPSCRGPLWPADKDLIFDSNVPDGAGGFFPIQLTANQCIVTGPDTLLIQVYFGRGGSPEIPGPPTLGAEHKLDGYTIRVNRDQVIPYVDLMRFSRECGVGPWVIVPHLMSDAGIAAMARDTLAGTPAGTKVRVEYSNEPWNIGFPQQAYLDARQYHFAYLNSIHAPPAEASDPTGTTKVDPRDWMECYCHYAANAHRIFKAAFDAAGRSADLVRVMGSQAGYARFPTWSICNYAFEHHITFDELAIETYVNSAPAQTRQYATDPTPAYDRLDPDGLIDVLGIVELLGGRDKVFEAHRTVMGGYDSVTSAPFGPAFASVKMVSYEGGMTEAVGSISDTGRRRIQLVHRTFRSPRMYRFELARLQNLDVNGHCTLAVRYNADKTDSLQGDVSWCEWALYNGPVGTGTPGENANPWAAFAHQAQTAGAMRAFAAAAMPPPSRRPPRTPSATGSPNARPR